MRAKTERELDAEHETKHRREMRKVLDKLEAVCTPIMQTKGATMVVIVRLPCGCTGHLTNTDELPFVVDWLMSEHRHPSTPVPKAVN